MAWLAKLDARTTNAARFVRWPYLSVKWFLIAMGIWIAIYMAAEEFHEHRMGLGMGMVVTGILALIKGVGSAITSHIPGSPSAHERPPLAH